MTPKEKCNNGVSDRLSSGRFLHFTEDDKFFCRLLSKDTSGFDDPSFPVYYGITSVAVPFLWESHPGTPKYAIPSGDLPPLTPPPLLCKPNKNPRLLRKNSSLVARSKTLLAKVLQILRLRRPRSIPPPPFLPSHSSSSLCFSMLRRRRSNSPSTFSLLGSCCLND